MQAHYTYRLSKRTNLGRIALVAFLVAVMTVAVTFGAIIHAYAIDDNETDVESAEWLQICVKKGDTLWSIAKEHAPKDENIDSYIHQLKKINGLSGSMLHEGQLLLIP